MVRSSSSALSFSALLAALRTFAGGTAQELEIAVDRLGDEEVDHLLALAARHRIVPLLARAMLPLSEKRVPPRLAVALQDAARAQASIALKQLQTVERLGAEFADARIDWLMMKGLALSQVAYGDPMLKAGIDIDILVEESKLPNAFTVLRRMGFAPIYPRDASDGELAAWHRNVKESVWGGHSVQIDLHHRLTDRAGDLDDYKGLPPSTTVQLGNGVEVKALREDWLLAHLAVHGASSSWFRWKWLADVAALLHRLGDEAAERIAAAAQLAPRREMSLMLDLVETWFPAASHLQPAPDLRTRLAGRLSNLYLSGLLSRREPTAVPMGTSAIHLTQILLARDSLRQARSIVQRARINP